MKNFYAGPLGLVVMVAAPQLAAQTLSLAQAQSSAHRSHPDLAAAREAVNAARGRERQAGAWLNPVLSWSREQTGPAGQRNSQDVFALEQPLEVGGQRASRRDAARLRHEASEVTLAAAEARIAFEVTEAYALAVAADRRAALAELVAGTFEQAAATSRQRLAAGDISGYAHRRIRLEAARYATLRAEATLARRGARLALATLVDDPGSGSGAAWTLSDSLPRAPAPADTDSLLRLALAVRPELRAAELEAQAAEAATRLAGRERIPTPTLMAGYKTENSVGVSGDLTGFVVGLSFPLALLDRRAGAIAGARGEALRQSAEAGALRRRVTREVREAHDAVRAVDQQLELLGPFLGAEAQAALRAAQVAYAEGEIPLIELLDGVRAWHETQAAYATLQAESVIRRAALLRATGSPAATTSGN